MAFFHSFVSTLFLNFFLVIQFSSNSSVFSRRPYASSIASLLGLKSSKYYIWQWKIRWLWCSPVKNKRKLGKNAGIKLDRLHCHNHSRTIHRHQSNEKKSPRNICYVPIMNLFYSVVAMSCVDRAIRSFFCRFHKLPPIFTIDNGDIMATRILIPLGCNVNMNLLNGKTNARQRNNKCRQRNQQRKDSRCLCAPVRGERGSKSVK